MPISAEEKLAAEAKKRRFLLIGVWLFSLIIVGFWVINLRASFINDRNAKAVGANSDSWQQDLKETINAVNASLNSKASSSDLQGKAFLSEMADNLQKKDAASGTPLIASSTPSAATSSTVATGTATVTPEKLIKELETKVAEPGKASGTCPQFIDCMPTIGASKPCVIPPGCENITQIAY